MDYVECRQSLSLERCSCTTQQLPVSTGESLQQTLRRAAGQSILPCAVSTALRPLDEPSLQGFDCVDEAVQALAAGQFIVVLDNEDRENEGDLILSGDKVCIIAVPPRLRDWRRCTLLILLASLHTWCCTFPYVLIFPHTIVGQVMQLGA